jgi:putative ABC transport system permease protein
MSIPGFVLKNAFRNRRRLLLSSFSVATSLFLLVGLQVFLRELTNPPVETGVEKRVTVRSRTSLANTLPANQRARVEAIKGVEAVTPLTYFGGKKDPEKQLMWAQFGCDPVQWRRIFPEAVIAPDQYEEWLADRSSVIVGPKTAKEEKLNIGDRISLISGIYPAKLELRVVGIYSGTVDTTSVFFHQQYLDAALGDWGKVGMWWVRVTDPDDVPRITDEINATFANTADEVLAETERAFQLGFVSMLGDIKSFIGSISSAVLLTLLCVTASSMSMAIRERFRELAILKAIGFKHLELGVLILSESFLLTGFGALLGIGGAWLMFTFVEAGTLTNGMFFSLEVTPRILASSAFIACMLGILPALTPAWTVARMSVVAGLKTLD